MLMCAARGEAIPQFRSFMNGVVACNSDVVSQSLELMLDAGGPASAGFLTGALHAFGSVSDQVWTRRSRGRARRHGPARGIVRGAPGD